MQNQLTLETHGKSIGFQKESIVFYAIIAGLCAMMICTQQAFAAADLWDTMSTIIKGVYDKIFGISTAVAVLALIIAFVLRTISQNQRTIDTADAWIKRIAISWVVINLLGSIFAYGQDIMKGTQWGA